MMAACKQATLGIGLIVVAGGLALGVQKAGPVLGLESLFQVAVDEDFNVLALRSDGES